MGILIFSLISFVVSVVIEIFVIKFCHKHSLYDTLNARKIHTGKIPRLGGIGIAVSYIISYVLYSIICNGTMEKNFLLLLLAGAIIVFFGVIDDLYELKAKQKLFIQIVAVAVATIGGFRFTQFFYLNLDANLFVKILSYVVTFIWVVGIINAYNMIDGLDGLCGSLTCLTCLTYGIIYLRFSTSAAAIGFILAASIIGFLIFNWPPAKTFMGDNGSQFLGFSVAVIALFDNYVKVGPQMSTFEFNKILIVLDLTALPTLDVIAAIWRRLREHRPIMSPDRSHIHHKLMNIGFSKTQILFILAGVQFFVCIIVLGVVYFMSWLNGFIVLGVTYLFMIIFFSMIHFANRAVQHRDNAVIEE